MITVIVSSIITTVGLLLLRRHLYLPNVRNEAKLEFPPPVHEEVVFHPTPRPANGGYRDVGEDPMRQTSCCKRCGRPCIYCKKAERRQRRKR